MNHTPRHILTAATLGLVPALLWIAFTRLTGMQTLASTAWSLLAGAAAGVIVLWLVPVLLYALLAFFGVKHVRVVVVKGMTALALMVALAPAFALLLLLIKIYAGDCSNPFTVPDAGLCHRLRIAGTWGFAFTVPAGGFIVLLGMLMLRLASANAPTETVAERAMREGLSAEQQPPPVATPASGR